MAARRHAVTDAAQLAAFLEMLEAERGASQNTLDAYRRDIADFAGFLEAQNIRLAALERRHCAAYLEGLGREGTQGWLVQLSEKLEAAPRPLLKGL